MYVSLEELFPKIATTDRQPYAQLEQALRKVGDDARANQVYLERRRVERKQMFFERRFLKWLTDLLYRSVANYGVRPYRLLGYTLLLIVLGTLFFSPPGALNPKDDKRVSSTPGDSSDYNLARALGVSVHEFLPIEVPVGSGWVPASRRISIPFGTEKYRLCIRVWPSVYGTCLRLAGAILVGIGLGSITGLLRRVST
jgi:hypothetical protein